MKIVLYSYIYVGFAVSFLYSFLFFDRKKMSISRNLRDWFSRNCLIFYIMQAFFSSFKTALISILSIEIWNERYHIREIRNFIFLAQRQYYANWSSGIIIFNFRAGAAPAVSYRVSNRKVLTFCIQKKSQFTVGILIITVPCKMSPYAWCTAYLKVHFPNRRSRPRIIDNQDRKIR